jgi:hypothetical protein
MFITSYGPEVIEPTKHMHKASRQALEKIVQTPLGGISTYLELGLFAGHAGDHMANVALWRPDSIELTDPETNEPSSLLATKMPLWAASRVVDSQRVTFGADFAAKTFAVSVETYAGSGNNRQETWQIASNLGHIMAKDAMDVSTFAQHTTDAGDQMYYPFSMFSVEMAQDPQKVVRGFAFGLQEAASAILAVAHRPDLQK